jgi:hypothetical protein
LERRIGEEMGGEGRRREEKGGLERRIGEEMGEDMSRTANDVVLLYCYVLVVFQ